MPKQNQTRDYSSRPVDNKSTQQRRPKVTIKTIQSMYRKKEPISMMTAQDYPSGLIVDQSGIDMCLVGDSLAMVSLGYDSTNPLTVEDMLHHCRAVARGAKAPFIVADLPYGSYEASPQDAVRVSLKFMKEGNCDAVKLEGGIEMSETIEKITRIGIPVLAHIGLTPQRQASLGGFRVQGKTAKQASGLLRDAFAVQKAGAFGVVLEAIPAEIAGYITDQLEIPTIGIGAGVECSGQVLVQNDALGLFDRFVPKFTKQYCNLNQIMTNALKEYHEEVKTRQFPAPQNTYPIDPVQLDKFFALEKERMGIHEEEEAKSIHAL
ncbi:3-methyl-2-oxobutanoate hydroxymethyltransferase [Choanephora cucurbitarum]|uniref:3-methyl-2-oxobutanoate hydroxymethyltransferase n=1 Tax=Choanephora cucurbitarum TaxID=101091 RepID=A0A1C7N9U8_9FUNG|nr:3-methyl-2-oxobutanoate hydroxymethyltransferase [Choanephora cucurbitarum]